MRAPILLALTLLVTAMAGCAENEQPAAATQPDVLLVTDENAKDALTNASFQMQAHLHDYWGGADKLIILDDTKTDQTLFISPEWRTVLLPADGTFVPQGTSRVEVTVSWSDVGIARYAHPELWVRTAADAEAVLIGPVENAATLTVPTTLASADLPHQSLSRWQFEWRIHPPEAQPGLIRWEGSVTMQVIAFRGLDIPVYPPHPDLWGDAETLPLLESGQGFGVWEGTVDAYNCYGSCPIIHEPDDGAIVPYDAGSVEVTLTPGDDSITDVGLKFHAADARVWIDLTPAQTNGKARVYTITVTPLMGDSPYASQSQWRFAPYISGPERDSIHAGSYAITARVLRAA